MKLIVVSGVIALVAIYLVVQAPPPLPGPAATTGPSIPVERLFRTVNAINAAARHVYTQRVVGPGLKAGLKFGEDWTEPGVEKGPLPALFLRLVAAELERRPERLGLFLGSDAPINVSNGFSGEQLAQFAVLKADREPKFFAMPEAGQVAMFADIASSAPCVDCHNDHETSPRRDWKLNDVMGATTWLYPSAETTQADYLAVMSAMLASVRATYKAYLDQARTFAAPPPIGVDWPAKGRMVLPDADTFMAEVGRAVGPDLLRLLGAKAVP